MLGNPSGLPAYHRMGIVNKRYYYDGMTCIRIYSLASVQHN